MTVNLVTGVDGEAPVLEVKATWLRTPEEAEAFASLIARAAFRLRCARREHEELRRRSGMGSPLPEDPDA